MPSKIKKRGENSYLLTVSAGTDGAGKRICHTKTVTASSPTEARKLYALFVAEIEKGQIATSGKMTLNDFFNYFEEHYSITRHKKKTIAYNRSLFKRVDAAMGHLRLDKITPKHLLSFYKNLAESGIKQDPNSTRRKIEKLTPPEQSTLSPNTIKKYHVLLHTLFQKASQWQMIAYNPADKVEPPKAVKTHKQIYDEDTTGRFLVYLLSEELKYRAFVLLALSTGMRKAEIYGLEWRHVDFDASTVKVEQTSLYLPEEGIFPDTTKTESSNRTVTVPTSVMELLKQYKTEQAANRLKLGDKWRPDTPAEAKTVDSERLFTKWDGSPSHPDSINKWLRNFAIKHDLPHITPHSFRHMSATHLIRSGVDLRTVAGKLGHANSTTTQLVYSHLVHSAEKETANAMEEFLTTTTQKARQKKQAT